MSKKLINRLPNDNPLPLHIVVIADWLDICRTVKDETFARYVRQELDRTAGTAAACLVAHKDDFDLRIITEEETDGQVLGMIHKVEGKVKVYRHIVAAYINTEHLKQLVKEALSGDT